MVLGGMAALGLPETLGRSLPQTLGDAEQFDVDCSFGSCCPNKRQTLEKQCKNSVMPASTLTATTEEESHLHHHLGNSSRICRESESAVGIPMTSRQRCLDREDEGHDDHNRDSESFHEFDKNGYQREEISRACRQGNTETVQVFLEQDHS